MRSLAAILLLSMTQFVVHAQYKICDTLFYDAGWRICEEPIAEYYRVGTLAVHNDLWYFSGPVRDYTIEHVLLMEGNYQGGHKQGPFSFYNDSGKLAASGSFEKGEPFGGWTYYYPDGRERAKVFFETRNGSFRFDKYVNEGGKVMLDNGTGEFSASTFLLSPEAGYQVIGSFKEGKKSGTWQYTSTGIAKLANFSETYDKEGRLKSSRYEVGSFGKKNEPAEWKFTPGRLEFMENIEMHRLFKANGDSVCGRELANYLIDHQPVKLIPEYHRFDSAFSYMLYKLARSRAVRFSDTKIVDADIAFTLGEAGNPEGIRINGSGINDDEKKYLGFFLGKFNGINKPEKDTLLADGNYHIYIYNIDVSSYYPLNQHVPPTQELIYSSMDKQKMLASLDANRKDIRKYLRKVLGN